MTKDEAKATIIALEAEQCQCVTCTECGGTGSYWIDFRGRYLGQSRCDDLDQLEPCEQCRNGVTEVCGRCECLETLYAEMEYSSTT